jgi:hypothetical protein
MTETAMAARTEGEIGATVTMKEDGVNVGMTGTAAKVDAMMVDSDEGKTKEVGITGTPAVTAGRDGITVKVARGITIMDTGAGTAREAGAIITVITDSMEAVGREDGITIKDSAEKVADIMARAATAAGPRGRGVSPANTRQINDR